MLSDFVRIIKEKYGRQPDGTEKVVNYKEVMIPYAFKATTPASIKIKKAFKKYKENGIVDKPISVFVAEKGDFKYILADEYTRWIVLSAQRIHYIPIKIIEK